MGKRNSDRRLDPRKAVERDQMRLQRRPASRRFFWRSLSLVGMVGWPITLCSVGGATLGHLVDNHFQTGVHFTLILITLGTALGSYIAWKSVVVRHD